MHNISRSVVKKDHAPKMEGRSVYVCDIDKHGILCGKMLRSKYARAKLLSVKVPELPDGYFYVDKNDVPGDNNVNIVMDDTPVYARETVEYIGEPIGMVCGPDEAVCQDILSRIQVEFEALETMLDLRKADEAFPSILGCQVAVAAKKCGKPVRCIFDRREDLEFTSKRHPSLCTYKVAAPQA